MGRQVCLKMPSLPAWPHRFIQSFAIITLEKILRQNLLYIQSNWYTLAYIRFKYPFTNITGG